MKLTPSDESVLAGGAGQGAALAMRIVVGAARALSAKTLIDIHVTVDRGRDADLVLAERDIDPGVGESRAKVRPGSFIGEHDKEPWKSGGVSCPKPCFGSSSCNRRSSGSRWRAMASSPMA